ncbi:MAG TPA: ribosome maturation factor RimM [Bacteroidales bacterium]|nr:ribosome maturation factor RimM [Bacteroidales bacterium]HPR72716.1 ribosome maturation factor RimM [Bacteroidales bacterium]
MAYKADILLGKIKKIHGHEGEVVLRLENTFKNNLPELDWVFLLIEGKPVPFLLSRYEYSGADILIAKFEGYDSSDAVKEFTGCEVFLETDRYSKYSREITPSLQGFRFYDKKNKITGTVKEIIENPGQRLLNIITEKNTSILIPFHPDLIISLDEVKKTIRMDIPDGLAEVN